MIKNEPNGMLLKTLFLLTAFRSSFLAGASDAINGARG